MACPHIQTAKDALIGIAHEERIGRIIQEDFRMSSYAEMIAGKMLLDKLKLTVEMTESDPSISNTM